jgi:hypothetical protein
LSLGYRKLGVLIGLAALLLALVSLRPGLGPVAEASLAAPGGISALPSGGPAFPGVADQALPAIIRARAPGNHGIVTVFCDPGAQAPAPLGLAVGFPLNCPVEGAGPLSLDGTSPSGAVTFKITRLYPTTGGPASTFTATGTDTLVCADNAGCDLSATPRPSPFANPTVDVGVVAVEIDGGGANEILEVSATDEFGERRAVQVVVIDTVLAFGPSGPVSTASQVDPLVISYACDTVGAVLADADEEIRYDRRTGVPATAADADEDGIIGLDDLWDLLYGYGTTFGWGLLDNAPLRLDQVYPPQYEHAGTPRGDVDIPLYKCGGNSQAPLDDAVTFEASLGLFSIQPAAQSVGDNMGPAAGQGLLIPPFFNAKCPEGKSVDITDVDSGEVWARALNLTRGDPNDLGPFFLQVGGSPAPQEGGCDLDFAPNGVVSYLLLGNGEVGTVTVSAQQGGGASLPRTINGVFVGEPKLSLFLTAPAVVGPEGADFSVAVVDQGFRPVATATVQCTVDPTGGALMVIPQTGTTGGLTTATPGQVEMHLVPTGKAVEEGEALTLTCVADRDRSVKGTANMTLSSTPVTESLALVAACNPAVSTWPDETPIETMAGAVAPPEALDAIWALNLEGNAWLGFSPTAPEGVNDLVSLNQLDAFFVCTNAAATLTRPVI